MQIIIKCDCGNDAVVPVQEGKYAQLRDHLNAKQFRLTSFEIKNGTLREFKIECDKCKRYITLGVD